MAKRPTKFTPQKRSKYLEELRKGARRGEAARAVGVTRWTVRAYYNEHPDFAAKVEDAELEANEKVEYALFQAATEDRNVTAIQVWLYNRMPHRWVDKRRVTHAGDRDQPIAVEDADALRESLARRITGIAERLGEEEVPRSANGGRASISAA